FVGDAKPFDRTSILDHLGETFRVTAGASAGVVIELVEVVDLPTQIVDAANEQFIAHFLPKSGPLLATGTYEFASASFGRLPLFLGHRLTDQREPFGYQALVNRFVPAGHTFNATGA
ncbi:MAG TPA: hypothetical protein VMM60_12435, partial [Ilumatobacter sp.]|nr:hypothetical protein [Ilumatobacter sp.]